MARKKVLFYGYSFDEKYELALGFDDWQTAGEIIDLSDFVLPEIDWTQIEDNLGFQIQEYAKDEIKFHFKCMLGSHMRQKISNKLSGSLPEKLEVSNYEFQMRAEKIEILARKLAAEINGLADIGSILLARPRPLDGLTSAEEPDEFYSKVSGSIEPVNEKDFFDYYTFRKMLDYYENFQKSNLGFRSVLASRFDRANNHSGYEFFVRRSLLALWATDFPMTITIPTDTNPDFESPVVKIFCKLREQLNEVSSTYTGFSELFEDWDYRKHARFLTNLRKEFEDSEIFWPLVAIRHSDNPSSSGNKD